MIVSLEEFPLLEDKVNRLINSHSKNGFAVVSACRSDNTREENLAKTEALKEDLKKMGWSYTIAYGGGFKEKVDSTEFDPTKPKFNEISFVVYNYNRFGKRDFLKDMIQLCGDYIQDDIYYQEPNGKAYWYDKNGKKDATFPCMTKNDDGQMFFTGFSSSKLSKKTKDLYLKKGKLSKNKAFEHRFSGIMEAIEPPPCTRVEEIKRRNNGEVFVSAFNVLTEDEATEILLGETKYFNY